MLAAALSYAFAGVYGRRFKAMGLAPVVTATGQITVIDRDPSGARLRFSSTGPGGCPPRASPRLLSILALAMLSTSFAYILFFRLLATAGATNPAS